MFDSRAEINLYVRPAQFGILITASMLGIRAGSNRAQQILSALVGPNVPLQLIPEFKTCTNRHCDIT